MKFEDLKKLYLKKKATVGEEAYKYVSQILKKSKSPSQARLEEKSYRRWRPRTKLACLQRQKHGKTHFVYY